MVRVCHIQVLPILSGVQRVMLDIFRHVDRSRYELHVVCQSSGPLTDVLEQMGISVHRLPSLQRSLHPRNDWIAYRALARLFRSEQFHIVHTHSSKPGILGRLAAAKASVPCVVHHVHAFAFHEFSPRWKHWVYGGLERRAASRCSHLVFVNQEERELAIRRGWIAADRCTTIYNGADLRHYNPIDRAAVRDRTRGDLGVRAGEVLILFNGRLAYPKQPELLPEIAARLNRLRPDAAWRMVIAGDGPAKPYIHRRCADLGLDHRVTMLDWVDDCQPLLCSADVALQTSLAEGLPLALIEAHAAGLPAVASRAKGNREVVQSTTGVLCDPRSADEFARALATLIDDPETRLRMGAAARKRAETHFDTSINSRRIAELYDRLVHDTVHRQQAPLRRRAA